MKDSKNLFKRLGFIGISLCASCCLIPIVGVLFGIGSLTFIIDFLEIAGIIAMVAAIVLFASYLVGRPKAPACDIDCTCKDQGSSKVKSA